VVRRETARLLKVNVSEMYDTFRHLQTPRIFLRRLYICGLVQLWKVKGAGIISRFLISNFRPVLYVVCFLLGNSPASEFYMPTFRNILFHLHRQVGVEFYAYLPMKMEQSVPKRRHIKFRHRGITQKKTYSIISRYSDISVQVRNFRWKGMSPIV
jgi:hypothetical protein